MAPAIGLPADVADLTFHEQHVAIVGAIIEPCFALRQRRAGDVQRPLDGARGAAGEPGATLGLVEAQIEEMFEHDARHDQSELVLLARLREIGNAGPELIHRDVEIVDSLHNVEKEAIDHLF